MDGCCLITGKKSGKESGGGVRYLHIKGAVLGTFEDQTSNRAVQESHESKFKVR